MQRVQRMLLPWRLGRPRMRLRRLLARLLVLLWWSWAAVSVRLARLHL